LPVLSTDAVHIRGVGVSAPLPEQASPSGIKPLLLDSTVLPLSRFSVAGGPKSYGFHLRLSRHRRRGRLSPSGWSASPTDPVLPEPVGSTFQGRFALLLPSRSASLKEGFRPHPARTLHPETLSDLPHRRIRYVRGLALPSASDRLKLLKRQNRSSVWARALPEVLSNLGRAGNSPFLSSRALAPFRFAGASFRRFRLALHEAGSQPSSIRGVGCPISPSSRSELASR